MRTQEESATKQKPARKNILKKGGKKNDWGKVYYYMRKTDQILEEEDPVPIDKIDKEEKKVKE